MYHDGKYQREARQLSRLAAQQPQSRVDRIASLVLVIVLLLTVSAVAIWPVLALH